jgi:hypothetical protein
MVKACQKVVKANPFYGFVHLRLKLQLDRKFGFVKISLPKIDYRYHFLLWDEGY